jgi:hypothetical protein
MENREYQVMKTAFLPNIGLTSVLVLVFASRNFLGA